MSTEQTHPLATWLALTGQSAACVAREVGVSRAYLSLILKGRRRPSADVLLRISRYTGIAYDRLRRVA